MKKIELIFLYEEKNERPGIFYFDLKDKKIYRTDENLHTPDYSKLLPVYMIAMLTAVRIIEFCINRYHLALSFAGWFSLDVILAALTIYTGNLLEDRLHFSADVITEIRRAGVENDVKLEELKERESLILNYIEINKKYLRKWYFSATALSLFALFLGNGLLFVIATNIWEVYWMLNRLCCIRERKRWLLENGVVREIKTK